MPLVCAGLEGVVSGFPTRRFANTSISSLLLCCPRLAEWRRRSSFAANGLRARLQGLEEPSDLAPDLLPAAEATPARADQSHQAVALVDRDQEVLGGSPRPVDQQRLHVGLHAPER